MTSAAKIALQEPYQTRQVRFVEIFETAGWRLKLYRIAYRPAESSYELIAAAKKVAARHLRTMRTRHASYGVGFLGVHDGRGSNQVFLDLWINENELMHTYWVSEKNSPAQLERPPEDFNSVCVWDLALQCYERKAWIENVLASPAGPDVEAYLRARLNAQV